MPQHRAVRLGRAHQTCRERAGLDQRGRFGRAEPARDRDSIGEPRSPARTARGIVLGGVAGVGRQAPISPRIAELGGKFGMELEAPPRQWIERAAAAPVERQKAARLAGGRAGDLVTLDDDRPRATSACEVGDRGADRATTADHDALARAHTSYCVRLGFPVPEPRPSRGNGVRLRSASAPRNDALGKLDTFASISLTQAELERVPLRLNRAQSVGWVSCKLGCKQPSLRRNPPSRMCGGLRHEIGERRFRG